MKRRPSDTFEDGITRVRGPFGHGHERWPPLSIGLPEGIRLIAGETPEQRAFRRFPIDRHKPGPAE